MRWIGLAVVARRASSGERALVRHPPRRSASPAVEHKGLWASNISLAIPAMSDAALERLLREGVHPDREIYVMPSKQTQFLSERDMAALAAIGPGAHDRLEPLQHLPRRRARRTG